jgi:hypothetical protein
LRVSLRGLVTVHTSDAQPSVSSRFPPEYVLARSCYSISLVRSVSPSTHRVISGARCPTCITTGRIVISNQVGGGGGSRVRVLSPSS